MEPLKTIELAGHFLRILEGCSEWKALTLDQKVTVLKALSSTVEQVAHVNLQFEGLRRVYSSLVRPSP